MIVRTSYDTLHIAVPDFAGSLTGFRQWARSDTFPNHGSISFINGEVLVDMSPEKLHSHNKVKAEVSRVVGNLVKQFDLGEHFCDGAWVTDDDAGLSTEPDDSFVSWESFRSGRVSIVPTADEEDGLELRGGPDWILEVVSNSSEKKDLVDLPLAYHRARVEEYWIIDARGEDLDFTIKLHGVDGFDAVKPSEEGWHLSKIFAREFQLRRNRNQMGNWQYTLNVRNVGG